MHFLVWLIEFVIIGLIAGAIAKAIMPGKQGGGWLVTMLLGMAGSLLGGFIANLLWGGTNMWSFWGLIVAILGALLVLFIYGFIQKRSTVSGSSSGTGTR